MRAAVVVEADPVVDDAVGEVETTPPRSEPFQPHNRSIYARFWQEAKRYLTKGQTLGAKKTNSDGQNNWVPKGQI